jgi:p-aminobenzoyl-glutamate transporter AbgT
MKDDAGPMTIEQQALALVNEGSPGFHINTSDASHATLLRALRTALERHEALRQEVSEKLAAYFCGADQALLTSLGCFIIAPPVDPIVATMNAALGRGQDYDEMDATDFRRELAKHGLKIAAITEGE